MSSSRFFSRRIAWAAMGLAATVLAGTARADEFTAVRQKTVDYADLNLAVPADADTLYTRLRAAAKAVCGEHEGREIRQLLLQRKCYRDTLATAVARVNHNSITALHRSDTNSRLVLRRTGAASRS